MNDSFAPHLVPDLLAPGLKLVLCGTALGAESARQKAYYANPGNQFWKAIHRIGLTPRLFKPKEYPELLTLGIGLTDLCKTVSGNDDQLPEEAWDPEGLKEKILRYQPKLLAFTSKTGAQRFFRHVYGRKVEYGLQPETLGATRLYVCSSPSGRARRFWREEVWQGMADYALHEDIDLSS